MVILLSAMNVQHIFQIIVTTVLISMAWVCLYVFPQYQFQLYKVDDGGSDTGSSQRTVRVNVKSEAVLNVHDKQSSGILYSDNLTTAKVSSTTSVPLSDGKPIFDGKLQALGEHHVNTNIVSISPVELGNKSDWNIVMDVPVISGNRSAKVVSLYELDAEKPSGIAINHLDNLTSCRIGETREELSNEDVMCKRNKWQQFKDHPEYKSRLFRVSLEEEYNNSISGTILDPLSNYKSPCWYTKLTKDHVPLFKIGKPQDYAYVRVLEERLNNSQTWRLRCFPYVFIIGAAKSGTTDIFRRLAFHPQIFPSSSKENFYWNWGRLLGRRLAEINPRTFTHYLNHYSVPSDKIRQLVKEGDPPRLSVDPQSNSTDRRYHPGITMDATATYSYGYDGWELIPGNTGLLEPKYILPHTLTAIYPAVKVIMILRNPTDRAYSHYRYVKRIGESPEQFHDLVVAYLESWKSCVSHNTPRGCAYNGTIQPPGEDTWSGIFVKAGIYSIFIRDWLDALLPNHMYVIHADDYYGNETQVITKIIEFLELDPISEDVRYTMERRGIANTAARRGDSRSMLPETKRILDEFYRPFNTELVDLLGDPKFLWEEPG